MRIAEKQLGLMHTGKLDWRCVTGFGHLRAQSTLRLQVDGKHEKGIRDGDPISVLENALGDGQTVDQSAIATSQIADEILITFAPNCAMATGGGAALDADGRCDVAPDHCRLVVQRELHFEQRSCDCNESGTHIFRRILAFLSATALRRRMSRVPRQLSPASRLSTSCAIRR